MRTMLPLIPIVASLVAQVAPDLLRIFAGEKQADVASKVIELARGLTGQDDPKTAIATIQEDPKLAIEMRKLLMDNQKALEDMNTDRYKTYVGDVQDARKYRDKTLFIMGVVIYFIFFMTVACTLVGGYQVLIAPRDSIDPVMLAAVSAFVGSIVGYVASQAQAVTNFNYGTSYGSMTKGDNLADAVKQFGQSK